MRLPGLPATLEKRVRFDEPEIGPVVKRLKFDNSIEYLTDDGESDIHLVITECNPCETTMKSDGDPVVAEDMPVVAEDMPVVADDMPVVADDMPLVADLMPVVADDIPVVVLREQARKAARRIQQRWRRRARKRGELLGQLNFGGLRLT